MGDGLRLIGVLVLTPDQVGFVDPVFQNGDKRYVQRAREDVNEVTGFDEIALAFAVEPRVDDGTIERAIGDRRLFAFRYADGAVAFGDRRELAHQLRLRFADFYSDEEFRRNPLLFFDVLSFLEFDDALSQEMTMRTLWASYTAARESQQGREAGGRLFQYGFCYAALSGRVIKPFDAGILCVRESDFRSATLMALRRLKTGRLVPVFCLLALTSAVVLSDPLSRMLAISSETQVLAAQGAAVAAILWFVYEATALSGRLGWRRVIDWLEDRLRAMTLRR